MWYHGDTVKRTTFADQKWDRDATRDPNSHGPGIYWTSDYQQAKGYAYPTGYIYTAQIEGNFVSDSTPASRQFLQKLIKEVPKEDLYYALSNFDENPNKAMQMALSMYGEESFIDGALSVYSDFFRKDSRKWIAAMVALGIDGYLHEVGNVTYLIVYNADLIQVTKEEHYSQVDKEALAPSWMHEAQKEGCMNNLKKAVQLLQATEAIKWTEAGDYLVVGAVGMSGIRFRIDIDFRVHPEGSYRVGVRTRDQREWMPIAEARSLEEAKQVAEDYLHDQSEESNSAFGRNPQFPVSSRHHASQR